MKSVSTGYVRPEKTHQEMLSNADIKNKLKEYKKVDPKDIFTIPIGNHIRYFTIDPKTKNKLFRLGGMLQKIDPKGRYISLSNGTIQWSVQLANSILYQKMTNDEIIKELKEEIKKEVLTEEKIEDISLLKEHINKLQNELKDLNKIKKENEKLNNKMKNIKSEIIKTKNNV
jgi:hypothetical protein